jgi:hypothetical protein
VDTKAIIKAEIRCEAATDALSRLGEQKDLRRSAVEWFSFLTAWKGVYTVLEQGAKTSQSSKDWFEAKRKERLNDPLLTYLYEARNDEEHGLDIPLDDIIGEIKFRIPEPGEVPKAPPENLPIDGIRLTREDGGPIEIIRSVGPGIALMEVTNRKGNVVNTPEAHFGQPLVDTTPQAVAALGLAYIKALTAEAKAL